MSRGESVLQLIQKFEKPPDTKVADVTRQARNAQPASNLLALKVRVYLNPGAWTGGRTDFGLVSQDQIAMASWLMPPDLHDAQGGERPENARRDWSKVADAQQGAQSLARGDVRITQDNPIHAFLELGKAAGTRHVKHVFSSYQIPSAFNGKHELDFTGKGELLIFLGDIHMHLFRECPADAFTKTQEGKNVSLMADFKDFLDYYRAFKQGRAVPPAIYQLGDLVDIWHAQSICLEAHCHLKDLIAKQMGVDKKQEKKEKKKDSAQDKPAGSYKAFVVYTQVPLKREVHFRDILVARELSQEKKSSLTKALQVTEPGANVVFREVDPAKWPQEVCAFDALALYTHLHKNTSYKCFDQPMSLRILSLCQDDAKINCASWDSVYKAIQKQYSEMNDYWKDLVAVQGNHDMFVDHPYMEFLHEYGTGGVLFKQDVEGRGFRAKGSEKANRQRASAKMKKYRIRFWPAAANNDPDWKKSHVKWVWHEDDTDEDPAGPTAAAVSASKPCECRAEHGFLTGRNNCIWFEHGHAFDPYNNRHIFFRYDHRKMVMGGFPNTGNYVRGKFQNGPGYVKTIAGVDVGKAANANLNDYVMRRCQAIFQASEKPEKKNSPVRLVALAHTHYPWLIVGPDAIQVTGKKGELSSFRA